MSNPVLRRFTVIPLAVVVSAALVACGSQSKTTGSNAGASNSSGTSSGGSSSGSSSSGAYGAYGSSSSSSTASGGSSTKSSSTVSLAKTSKGQILVDSKGFTLYLFTPDGPNKDTCANVSGCTSTWPPLTTSGHPTAGSGVSKSMLGTVKLSNGREQVVYAGHPLYTYTGDSGPANTSYIGATSFGGTWLAVSAAGKPVH